ncbi:amyloid beta A4 precursor protein-binding family B member 1-interacting protein [Nilaparvata lugens]|uniref:amyloid beta A4 precursor protein-binding family B member 1-interacting protein n=1 Tax=Nilaparvata lugens TaxID=108931 RepID=UPI00193D97E9|nr:amyloid beta A4 precursor protein-binding family B member 1-interacting protein [Nilaparvata lugens]
MLCTGSFRRKERPKLKCREDVRRRTLSGPISNLGLGAVPPVGAVGGSLGAEVYTKRNGSHTLVVVCSPPCATPPMGLERRTSANPSESSPKTLTTQQEDCIDSYRFSMANLEETQDVDLDAILGELCALESQYDEAIAGAAAANPNNGIENTTVVEHHRRQPSETPAVIRTDSPDNDSAFSDSVSLLSSESSASSGRNDCLRPSQRDTDRSSTNGSGKAEKIRLALQKMKEANVKKLFIKAFSADGSSKSLLVDETMSCAYVTRILAEKNHRAMGARCALVEHLPELHMERAYEDHELLVDQLMIWTRDSKNRILFVERPERTLLFDRPEMFLAGGCRDPAVEMDECSRSNLLEEFFANPSVPNVEGPLYIKTDSRKGWKRYNCVLRASGLYYWPKEKTKSSKSDLVCLATFDVNQVYYGVSWKKKYRAPTDHCFAIKHPCLQQPKSVKHIKFLCADDPHSLHRWVVGIRIAKHGHQLLSNYRSLVEECQLLAQGGSVEGVRVGGVGVDAVSRRSVAESTESESGSSGCDVGFECDFPSGTIKRKPPKLPLTATTRQLKEIAIGPSPIAASYRPHPSSPGSNLVSYGTNPGTGLNPYGTTNPIIGTGLNQYGTNTGTGLNQYGTNTGTGLNQYGTSPIVGTSLNSYGTNPGTGLNQYGTCNPLGVVPTSLDFKGSFESLPPPPPELLEPELLSLPDDEDLPPPPPPPPRLPAPSAAFLQDLQRVMRRKWQVAQKCKQDLNTTPHEVLGFRDPPDYRETNVSNWVAEHYGQVDHYGQMVGPSLYENVYRPGVTIATKKRPPPPPPRAETTQLTTTSTARHSATLHNC